MKRAEISGDPDADAPPKNAYVDPSIHIAMLNDVARTRSFVNAVRAVVKPGDVVVDIGTGTGVLAATAARAGAKRVYAIEETSFSHVAQEIFEKNGVADRVEIVRGRSYGVTLPEPCDVLVTEMIGNDPLDEDLLEVVRDAHARLIAPGARVIPAEISLYVVLVDIPELRFERMGFTAKSLERWKNETQIDFSPLANQRMGAASPVMIRPREAALFPIVAEPVRVVSIDLTRPPESHLDVTRDIPITRDATHLAVALAFSATLAPNVTLSTVHGESHETNHWWYAHFPAWDRLRVRAGDHVSVRVKRRPGTTEVHVSGSKG